MPAYICRIAKCLILLEAGFICFAAYTDVIMLLGVWKVTGSANLINNVLSIA